jgi:predicted nucleic acid-binding protein
LTLPEGKRRRDLASWIENTMRSWFEGRVLPIDGAIAERWGILAGECKLRGIALSTADGLIVATALEHGLVIVTRNVKDFVQLKVTVQNPWDPADHYPKF